MQGVCRPRGRPVVQALRAGCPIALQHQVSVRSRDNQCHSTASGSTIPVRAAVLTAALIQTPSRSESVVSSGYHASRLLTMAYQAQRSPRRRGMKQSFAYAVDQAASVAPMAPWIQCR